MRAAGSKATNRRDRIGKARELLSTVNRLEPKNLRQVTVDVLSSLELGDAVFTYGIRESRAGLLLTASTFSAGTPGKVRRAVQHAASDPEPLATALGLRHPRAAERESFLEDQATHRGAFEDTGLFQSCYVPFDLRHHCRLLVYDGEQFVAWIGVIRMKGTPPFRPGERQSLQPLVRSVRSTLLQAQRLDTASESDGPADFIMRPNGSVEYACPHTRSRLASRDFRDALGALARQLERGGPAHLPALGALAPSVLRLDDENGRVRYLVHLTPTRPISLSRLAGLTPAQREVAVRAAAGAQATEIAAELRRSTQTVRTQLKHIYERLEISSRAELARVVLEDRFTADTARESAQ